MTRLEKIEAAHGARTLESKVPEWGCTVTAKRLTIADHLVLEKLTTKDGERDSLEYTLRMVQLSLVDDEGAQLIPDEKLYLLRESPGVLFRLAGELHDFNQPGNPEKNSESSPSEPLPSGSAD